MDIGSVRHWPRMPEAQLARVMAKGPLKYACASDRHPAKHAQPVRPALRRRQERGRGREDRRGGGRQAHSQAGRSARGADAKSRRWSRQRRNRGVAKTATAPFPQAKPAKTETYQVASAASKPVAKQMPASASSRDRRHAGELRSRIRKIRAGAPRPGGDAAGRAASASATDIINERGYWQGLPSADAAERRRPAAPAQRSLGAMPPVRPPAPIRRPWRATRPGR